MNESFEYWVVEQFVELGNESFWWEKARLLRYKWQTENDMNVNAHRVGCRDVKAHGGRYRIRVYKEETWYDSEENGV